VASARLLIHPGSCDRSILAPRAHHLKHLLGVRHVDLSRLGDVDTLALLLLDLQVALLRFRYLLKVAEAYGRGGLESSPCRSPGSCI